ncbi:MAG: hypothetical protein QGI05_04520, partial [Candidatus Omnitrophota bacterium]|nr:hypothetical protein [Candidatus Omnitrophota bacterium]
MRHRSRKFIPIVVILLVVALFLGYNYTTKKLTLFISKSFEENLGAKLSIKDIKFTLPFCVELKDVKVSDLIKIESVRVYPNPKEFLLRNRVALSMINVINPVVRIKKEEDNEFVLPDILKETKGETSSSFPLESLALSNIRIQNGTFIYEDEEK